MTTSTFFAGTGVQSGGGVYGAYWTDAAFSKFAYDVGPGTYSFKITGAGGTPADFGVRLDSASAGVPEPTTWALMVVGLGGLGAMVRRSRRLALAT